jgi:hypothetical protein
MKVFTFTAGRTGTGYLAECFKRNAPESWVVEHEGPFYGGYGTFRPDISHLHAYNCGQRLEHVREFWRRKFEELPLHYIETAHINCKAGLIEHLDLVDDNVVIIHLQRAVRDVMKSMIARGAFLGKANMWVWHLDPDYPCNIVDSDDFDDGPLGNIAWYLVEMEARAKKLRGVSKARWIDVKLEEIIQADGLESLLSHFAIPLREMPEKVNANPDLEFEPDLLLAIDNLSLEVEEAIKNL